MLQPKEGFVQRKRNICSGSYMASLPGLTRLQWYQRKGLTEAISSIPPIITVIVTSWAYMHDPAKKAGGYWLIIAAIWLAITGAFKVLQAYQEDKKRKEKESPQDLLGCIWVLQRTLCHLSGIVDPNDGSLRITMHRIVPSKTTGSEPEELEQILPYVGSPAGTVGRRTSIRCGVVGRVIREKEPFVSHRLTEDHEEYIKELVQFFGYTQTEARLLTVGRWSALGVPLYDLPSQENVIGVVFIDSSRRNFFSDEIIELTLGACRGINEYVSTRFAQ